MSIKIVKIVHEASSKTVLFNELLRCGVAYDERYDSLYMNA